MGVSFRKVGTVTLVLISGIILLTPIVLLVMTRTRPQNTTLNLPSRIVTPADALAREEKTPGGNTTKGEFSDGRYYVSLNGLVSDEPKKVGSSLEFHIIANDDPTRHILPVTLTSTDGTIPVGIFTASFDGVYTTKLASIEEARSLVIQGKPIQLRFMYYPDAVLDDKQREAREMLDSFVKGTPKISEEVALFPVGVGVIQL